MDWSALATDFVLALVPLFVVVDPLASIGLYLGLTARLERKGRDRIALRAVVFAGLVLLAFAFVGQSLLRYLGIELYSLRVAGGILLTLIGLNMLKEGEEVPAREIAEGELDVLTGGVHPAAQSASRPAPHDPSLVPLGLPMLAGPGAISLVILLGSNTQTAAGGAVVAAAILVTMLGSLLVLFAASRASNIIGENSRRVITRIMGLLTVAFAVQYIFDGVNGWLGSR